MDILIPVCYSYSFDIPRPAIIVFELLAILQLAKTNRKRKSVKAGTNTDLKKTWIADCLFSLQRRLAH
jgi:hypothetical protein